MVNNWLGIQPFIPNLTICTNFIPTFIATKNLLKHNISLIMKNRTSFKMASIALASILILSVSSASAQKKKKGNKKPGTESVKKDKDAPKKISEVTKKCKKIDGLFAMYQDTITGSIKMVVSKKQIGKEYIYFSQIADGVLEAGSFRGAYNGSKVFKIEKYFNKIEFVTQNTSSYFDSEQCFV